MAQRISEKNSYPYWLWLFLLAIAVVLFLGIKSWHSLGPSFAKPDKPFFQVTNREMSVFLWQFPKYMRANAKYKNNYLPGFQYEGKLSTFVEYADTYVSAPVDVLFNYHVWSRLIKNEWSERPIPLDEFKEFVDYAPEWLPHFWPGAPAGYAKFMDTLAKETEPDLQKLPESVLPMIVRQSFQGWKNYVKEGRTIDKFKPTVEQVREFLGRFPHYARNYWRNIVLQSNPAYLESVEAADLDPQTPLPTNEMSDFLLVAIYNYLHASNKTAK